MQDRIADFHARQGVKIRATANDIKRNAEALASELGEEKSTIDDVFSGHAHAEVFDRVIRRMVEIYPVSRLDLEVKRDDTDDGLVFWPPEKALASSRVFDREDSEGRLTPYYEYRDAAMSTVGPYKPEWIKTFRVVSSDDPEDPNVAYNNGHLMHQLTFFVGPVNFYWKAGGPGSFGQDEYGRFQLYYPLCSAFLHIQGRKQGSLYHRRDLPRKAREHSARIGVVGPGMGEARDARSI